MQVVAKVASHDLTSIKETPNVRVVEKRLEEYGKIEVFEFNPHINLFL